MRSIKIVTDSSANVLALQNPQWCRAAGERSQQIASTFDKSHFADEIENIYETVVQ